MDWDIDDDDEYLSLNNFLVKGTVAEDTYFISIGHVIIFPCLIT